MDPSLVGIGPSEMEKEMTEAAYNPIIQSEQYDLRSAMWVGRRGEGEGEKRGKEGTLYSIHAAGEGWGKSKNHRNHDQ